MNANVRGFQLADAVSSASRALEPNTAEKPVA
jgi:hypothetical protein